MIVDLMGLVVFLKFGVIVELISDRDEMQSIEERIFF